MQRKPVFQYVPRSSFHVNAMVQLQNLITDVGPILREDNRVGALVDLLDGYSDTDTLQDGRLVYHGRYHAVQTCANAHHLANYEGLAFKHVHATLLLAAAAHDLDHSFGALSDNHNIQNAIAKTRKLLAPWVPKLWMDDIASLIKVTEFQAGVFVHEPQTLPEMIMRDADLMGFCAPTHAEMLARLCSEIGMPEPQSPADWGPHVDWLADQRMFTRTALAARDAYVARWRASYA